MEGALEHPLGSDAAEAARARAITRAALAPTVPAPVVQLAELVTSELVTNALVHGAAPRSMSVAFDGADITVVVQDGAIDRPMVPLVAPRADDAGLGLRLVDAVATSWGCHDVTGGKRVHAVIPARDAGPSPAA